MEVTQHQRGELEAFAIATEPAVLPRPICRLVKNVTATSLNYRLNI